MHWVKWALMNTVALLFGFWAGSRVAGIVNEITFAYMYDPSHPSRHLFDAADFSRHKAANTAGDVAGIVTLLLFCLFVLVVAQWFIRSERDEPELLWWSEIGILSLPVGLGVGALASELIFPFVARRLAADYYGYAVGGMVIGVVQWLVLRRWVSLVGSSILTSAVALPVGFLVFLPIGENGNQWLWLTLSGAAYFAISGLPLLWLSPKKG